jgi:hypothetical protein
MGAIVHDNGRGKPNPLWAAHARIHSARPSRDIRLTCGRTVYFAPAAITCGSGPAAMVEAGAVIRGQRSSRPHPCDCVTGFWATAGGSVISVPPCPSLAVAKLEAMYWPSSAMLAVLVPSLTVSVPPVLPLLAA